MEGWIKLHRTIQENEFYFSERFTKAQAWIDLLLLATHSKRTVFIKGCEIRLKPGELCYSQVSLAKRWQWNVKTVSTYLQMLSKRKMLESRTDNITTVITVSNWCRYQTNGERNGEQKESGTETNKNDENGENVFVANLVQFLKDSNIAFEEEHLKARICKALTTYPQESVGFAVNEAVEGWKNNGHSGNFLSYFGKTLENNYQRNTQ